MESSVVGLGNYVELAVIARSVERQVQDLKTEKDRLEVENAELRRSLDRSAAPRVA